MSTQLLRTAPSAGDRANWLLPTAGILALLLAFGGLALVVRDGSADSFDRAVLLSLRDPADLRRLLGPRWLGEFARDVTGLGSVTVVYFVTTIVLGYLALSRKWADLALLAAAVAGGQGVSSLLKNVVARARPDLIPGAPQVFTASFPSGHALLSAVIYLTLGAILGRLEPRRELKAFYLAVAIFLTATIGVSRVMLGVHWPTDVAAGWCLGAAWALGCAAVANELRRRRGLEPLG